MVKWRIGLWAAIVVVALGFLYLVRGILLPFAVGYIIAVLLEPVVKRMRLMGFSRIWAVTTISVVFFAAAGYLAVITFPAVARQFNDLQTSLVTFTQNLSEESAQQNFFTAWNPTAQAQAPGTLGIIDTTWERLSPSLERFGFPQSRQEFVAEYLEPQRETIADSMLGFINGFFGWIAAAASQVLLLLLVPVLVFYFLMEMDQIRLRTASWIPSNIRDDILSVLAEIGNVFKQYMRGVTITILVYVIASAILLSLLGVPYSIILAILGGVFYLVPLIGAWITNIAVFLVTGFSGRTGFWAMEFEGAWSFALAVTLVYIVFGLIYDQVVYPRLVGGSVQLPPLVSMFVILAGAALFGLPGMVIAFPLAGAIKVTLARLMKLTNPNPEDTIRLPAVPLRHRRT